jgi:hypothetical protein
MYTLRNPTEGDFIKPVSEVNTEQVPEMNGNLTCVGFLNIQATEKKHV